MCGSMQLCGVALARSASVDAQRALLRAQRRGLPRRLPSERRGCRASAKLDSRRSLQRAQGAHRVCGLLLVRRPLVRALVAFLLCSRALMRMVRAVDVAERWLRRQWLACCCGAPSKALDLLELLLRATPLAASASSALPRVTIMDLIARLLVRSHGMMHCEHEHEHEYLRSKPSVALLIMKAECGLRNQA